MSDELLAILEWTGAAVVVASVWLFGRKMTIAGASAGAAACFVLGAWAILLGSYGILILQAVLLAVNLRTIWRELRK